ncbi:MAG: 4Fe-4S dicluster domain-containing protein [Promethearchaeota archaeon]|jgi:anaerobic dimethyl sulfoxide reductase subunit B (iron-sulfur subunit)
MKQMGFYFDQTRCTGCYTCSVACKDWNNINAGPENWMRVEPIEKGQFPNLSLSYLAIACNHCADPPCVKACPVNAITKRESDGIVLVDQSMCLGKTECGAKCLKVCPWDAPQFSSKENAKMRKCTLCVERLEEGKQTICVEACPMYALDVDLIENLQKKYGDVHTAEGFKDNEKIHPSINFKPKTNH